MMFSHIIQGMQKTNIKNVSEKPKPGMILKAIKENNLDRRDLFMIIKEVLLAKNSSIKFFRQRKIF